jgi:hypothetical protein
MTSIHADAVLNRRFMEMMKLLNIYLNHFPKFEKFALCNRIRDTTYMLYDSINEAPRSRDKMKELIRASNLLERLRMQLMLANELGYFMFQDGTNTNQEGVSVKRYLAINSRVDEIGRLIGGWMSSLSQ